VGSQYPCFFCQSGWQNRQWPLLRQVPSTPSPSSNCNRQPECSSYVANQPNLSQPLLLSTTAIRSSLNRGPNRQSPIHFPHGPIFQMAQWLALPQLLVYKQHVLTSPPSSRLKSDLSRLPATPAKGLSQPYGPHSCERLDPYSRNNIRQCPTSSCQDTITSK